METHLQAKIQASQQTPVASPTGKHIAHIQNQFLCITEIHPSPRIIRRYQLTEAHGCLISQLEWEPQYDGVSTRIAVLNDSFSQISIFNLDHAEVKIQLSEDPLFQIKKFQWIQANTNNPAEHLLIFAKDNLYAKFVSFEGQVQEFTNTELDQCFQRDDGIFALVLKKGNFRKCLQYIGFSETSVPLLYQSQLGTFATLGNVCFSGDSKWVLANDIGKNGVDIKVYPVIQPSSEPVMGYFSEDDIFGATDVQFVKSEDGNGYNVLFSDHSESIRMLSMAKDLDQISQFRHTTEIPKTAIVYQYQARTEVYTKSLGPFSMSDMRLQLPKHKREITNFKVHNGKIYSVASSLPNMLFIWSMYPTGTKEKQSSLEAVIITESEIKDFEVWQDMILLLNTNSITLYKEGNVPINHSSQYQVKYLHILDKSPLMLLVKEETRNNSHILLLNTPLTGTHNTGPSPGITTRSGTEVSNRTIMQTSNKENKPTSEEQHQDQEEQDQEQEEGLSTIFINDVLKNDNLTKLKRRSDREAFTVIEENDTFAGKRQRRA
ncbi:hypothetical protein WICPIJ_004406 [Wickerhamomyces pijperi]|uniref:Uncharacterized protein n=1 Tax=Wickerhamomyces pijperi TaxID=599730 RepID=A0A9P8TM25_WICPI|nr:hypothetical protein WICPIJ_004406 [Wickerhamomyces pijperi]